MRSRCRHAHGWQPLSAGEKLRLHPKGFDLKLHLAAVLHCDDKKAVSSMEWRMAVVSPRLWCNAAGKLLGSREIVAVLHRHGADDDVAVVAASGILRLAERDLSPAEAFHRELLVLTPDFRLFGRAINFIQRRVP